MTYIFVCARYKTTVQKNRTKLVSFKRNHMDIFVIFYFSLRGIGDIFIPRNCQLVTVISPTKETNDRLDAACVPLQFFTDLLVQLSPVRSPGRPNCCRQCHLWPQSCWREPVTKMTLSVNRIYPYSIHLHPCKKPIYKYRSFDDDDHQMDMFPECRCRAYYMCSDSFGPHDPR